MSDVKSIAIGADCYTNSLVEDMRHDTRVVIRYVRLSDFGTNSQPHAYMYMHGDRQTVTEVVPYCTCIRTICAPYPMSLFVSWFNLDELNYCICLTCLVYITTQQHLTLAES